MTSMQITGAVTGLALAAGAAALFIGHQRKAPARKLRSTATRAVRTINNVLNTVEDAMK